MGLYGILSKKEKILNEYFQKKIIKMYYKKRFNSELKKPCNDYPGTISNEAISSIWKPYYRVDPRWARYYWSFNSIASPYYIPSDIWFGNVCRKLNSLDRFGWPMLQDKNYLDLIFHDVQRPEVIVHNIAGQYLDMHYNKISIEQAITLCEKEEELIIKPSISSKGGRGIEFYTHSNNKEEDEKVLSHLFADKRKDFVVQRILRQHHTMAVLNPDSINTIRVQTLLWNGEVHILSSLVRIGVKGCRIDNPHTSDGVSCVLDDSGMMTSTAYDRNWQPYTTLPDGQEFKEFRVPYYDRIISVVKKLQFRVPHSRLVGWDMSISEDGDPILIEANLDYPEIYFHQLGGGPIIKDELLFNEIMEYISE